MPRKVVLPLALSAVAVAAMTTLASAASVTVRSGNLLMTLGGGVSPQKMPRNSYVPVKTRIFGEIKASDGSHPPALREVVVDIDKDARVNPVGYPVCKPGKLEARDTSAAKKVCGKATIGSGLAHAEIAFPEQKPINVTSPITVFNGGQQGGKASLLIHTFITVPVPAAIVTQVTIQKKGSGQHAVARIPMVAGGSGSAIDFDFTVGKAFSHQGKKVGFFEGRCPDGKFKAKATKILFRNEAKEPSFPPQAALSGTFVVPCTPKG